MPAHIRVVISSNSSVIGGGRKGFHIFIVGWQNWPYTKDPWQRNLSSRPRIFNTTWGYSYGSNINSYYVFYYMVTFYVFFLIFMIMGFLVGGVLLSWLEFCLLVYVRIILLGHHKNSYFFVSAMIRVKTRPGVPSERRHPQRGAAKIC